MRHLTFWKGVGKIGYFPPFSSLKMKVAYTNFSNPSMQKPQENYEITSEPPVAFLKGLAVIFFVSAYLCAGLMRNRVLLISQNFLNRGNLLLSIFRCQTAGSNHVSPKETSDAAHTYSACCEEYEA